MPAATASRQAAASFILLAPTSRISFGSRPASRAAAAMFARIRAMFSAIVISVPILLSSGRPAAISLSAANHLSII